MENTFCVAVRSQTETAEARRVAMHLADHLGFDETESGNAALVVTEAAKNLLKHAGGGQVLLRATNHNSPPSIDMVAVDNGPGIADIGRSFQDGYSTAGTPGNGLGAIGRLSNLMDVYSQPGQGTVLFARVSKRVHAPQTPRRGFRMGAVSVPMAGESVCGDSWSFREIPRSGGRMVIADGLGHGLLAADASRAAIRISDASEETGVRLIERIHEGLRPTRGAAVAVAEIDVDSQLIRYTGIGNIAGTVISETGAVRHMVSHAGSAGHEARKFAEFSYPWTPGSLLIMHSDGLQSHWSFQKYPGLAAKHPAVIAGLLYRDFTRGRDDVTVTVACGEEAA